MMFCSNNIDHKIEIKEVLITPAFHNLFVETLINTRDHLYRDENAN